MIIVNCMLNERDKIQEYIPYDSIYIMFIIDKLIIVDKILITLGGSNCEGQERASELLKTFFFFFFWPFGVFNFKNYIKL